MPHPQLLRLGRLYLRDSCFMDQFLTLSEFFPLGHRLEKVLQKTPSKVLKINVRTLSGDKAYHLI